MRLGVIGLGLIGGSWALAMRKKGMVDHVIGWDQSPNHLEEAKNLRIIDRQADSAKDVLKNCDVLILAIPVDAIEQQLPQLLSMVSDNQLIVDFGSTKSAICKVVVDHPMRSNYLAAHPITGTEYNGPGAAFPDLYDDKVMILCDVPSTDETLLKQFQANCKSLDMEISTLSSEEHDLHLAYVSHLSHVTAYSLSNAVLKIEEQETQILELAGSGFASTVRLAKSSPEMWTPIFLKNRTALLDSVNAYLEEVLRFKTMLEARDSQAIYDFLEEGRKIRKILK